MRGGKAAQREAQRMVSEKMFAAGTIIKNRRTGGAAAKPPSPGQLRLMAFASLKPFCALLSALLPINRSQTIHGVPPCPKMVAADPSL
jgi:hypothetical protein